MPYKTIKELPTNLQDILPIRAQEIYIEAFNSSWDGTCKDREDKEGCSNAIAWTAIKNGFKKTDNGEWIKKEESEAMEIWYRGLAFEAIETIGEDIKFKKDLIHTGTFTYPQNPKQHFTVTQDRMQRWVDNFHKYIANGGKISVPLKHTTEPDRNAGWVKDMVIEGDKLFGIIAITDMGIAKKIEEKSIQDVSISILHSITDDKNIKYDDFVEHVALTPIPHIRGQGPFIRLEQFYELKEEGMDDILIYFEKSPILLKLMQDTQLMNVDWDKDKFSDKDWGATDKTKLDKSAFLYVPDPEKQSTWKLPFKDENGKINIGAVKAIWGVLQGAHGQEVDIPADELVTIKEKVDNWRKELGLGEYSKKEETEMDKTKELEGEIKKLQGDKLELEKKNTLSQTEKENRLESTLATLKTELTTLQKTESERKKIELDTRIDKLVTDGKLPPALKEKVITLSQGKAESIKLEQKNKDGKMATMEVTNIDLLLELLDNLPRYEGFKEKTATTSAVEMEKKEVEQIATNAVRDAFGKTKTDLENK